MALSRAGPISGGRTELRKRCVTHSDHTDPAKLNSVISTTVLLLRMSNTFIFHLNAKKGGDFVLKTSSSPLLVTAVSQNVSFILYFLECVLFPL